MRNVKYEVSVIKNVIVISLFDIGIDNCIDIGRCNVSVI